MENYILDLEEFKKIDVDSILKEEIIKTANEIANKEFGAYIKSNNDEGFIKKAGFDYFIAIYLLIKSKPNVEAGFKTKLRDIIINNYQIDNTIQNLDFYLGSCGIEAQNLAINNNANI